MATWNDFRNHMKSGDGEGMISHMYLDTKGYVTVGVGNKLSTVAEAQQLSFINRQTTQAATKDEIKSDYDAVNAQTKGQVASKYKQYTKLDLPQGEIDKLLDTRIDGFKQEIRQKFPKFDTYPVTVQFALLDMAFNLGANGLVTKFPKFKAAIEAEDWKKAAKESNRPDVSTTRNEIIKKWLEEAAG